MNKSIEVDWLETVKRLLEKQGVPPEKMEPLLQLSREPRLQPQVKIDAAWAATGMDEAQIGLVKHQLRMVAYDTMMVLKAQRRKN